MNAPLHQSVAAQASAGLAIDGLFEHCEQAVRATNTLLAGVERALRTVLAENADAGDPLQREQARAHGFAWAATYGQALHEMLGWGRRLQASGKLGELETLMLQAAFGEYLAQLAGGLPMSQGEIFRVDTLDTDGALRRAFEADPAVALLRTRGFSGPVRARIAALLAQGQATRSYGDPALDDATLVEIREQFARYADDHAEAAHQWHLANDLIPDAVLRELAQLGVFGLTIPEEFGGSGLGKTAMCVVTEELSRGYIGLGSLGTRTEIAGELITLNGTDEQKRTLLPRLASGEIIPTAAFTEPDTGSDLGSLRTRAERHGDVWRVSGNKTWITHGARSDMMTLLVRTDRDAPGYKGLSMFLAPKPRGTDANPFPAPGMSGGEIHVLGYRGMKEYEIGFDNFEVPASALLGGVEGRGFKQLMQTFESARIQTGARAVGVAQNAFELDRAPAHAVRRAREGRRPSLRPGGRHGQAAGRPGGVGQRRQRRADPRRQRVCPGVPHQPRAVRRPHPERVRRRGRDPGQHRGAQHPRRTALTERYRTGPDRVGPGRSGPDPLGSDPNRAEPIGGRGGVQRPAAAGAPPGLRTLADHPDGTPGLSAPAAPLRQPPRCSHSVPSHGRRRGRDRARSRRRCAAAAGRTRPARPWAGRCRSRTTAPTPTRPRTACAADRCRRTSGARARSCRARRRPAPRPSPPGCGSRR